MVGRRGKRGAAAANASPATRSSRNIPQTPAQAPRARGRGRGRGRWAQHWASRILPGRSANDGRVDDQGESPRRSHIIKLKLPSLRKLGLGSSSTATSADQTATAPDSTSGSHPPETPRARRSKRAMAVPESSRTTRQSARLKPSEEMATEEATPSKLADNLAEAEAEAEAEADNDMDVDAHANADTSEVEDGSSSSSAQQDQADLDYHPKLRLRLSPPKPPTTQKLSLTFSKHHTTDANQPKAETVDVPESSPGSSDSQDNDDNKSQALLTFDHLHPSVSPRLSRKRKSESAESPEPSGNATKKLKLEDSDSAAAIILQNGNDDGNTGTSAQMSSPEDSAVPSGLDPTVAEASIEEPTESGRGRGRGRGRARGRGSRGGASRGGALAPTRGTGVRGRAGRGRGRGRWSAASAIRRGGKRIEDEIWDSESRRRTPSPVRATQPIKDRAEELTVLFKKVGQAQQLALSALAERSMQKIARDPDAHEECPEYDLLMRELGEYLRKALTRGRAEYDHKVASANRVYLGNLTIVEKRTQASLENIQDEMFYAARGKYMELVAGRRAAEDDEHTETDGSDAESEEPPYLFRIGKAGQREVERGFFAEAVRTPDGAAALERGKQEWEDFVKKVRLGEDLNPQMQALDSSAEASTDSLARHVETLLQAARVVAEEPDLIRSYDGGADPPRALSLLAETAILSDHPPSAPTTPHYPQMRSDPHLPGGRRTLLPQPQGQIVAQPTPPGMTHGPTDPRSFILPRPTPTQQPRRLLPARSPLGMGLPDPFAMTGPPQLPPPPGSNFHRLPMPWTSGPPPPPPQQGGQQPGPGHGPGSTGSHSGPGPHGGPPPLYFPPPPPRRY